MKKETPPLGCFAIVFVGVLIIASPIAWQWYRAGVQQQVYARQGIECTRWELFIGALPAERVIRIKEDPAP